KGAAKAVKKEEKTNEATAVYHSANHF
ncbi:MAG: hypothetical protein RL078_20, partial [Bacteroidota bacterium]